MTQETKDRIEGGSKGVVLCCPVCKGEELTFVDDPVIDTNVWCDDCGFGFMFCPSNLVEIMEEMGWNKDDSS